MASTDERLRALQVGAEEELGIALTAKSRATLHAVVAQAWLEGEKMSIAQSATLNDVVGKLDEIRHRIAVIEQRQTRSAEREDDIDRRLQSVESAERKMPWKMLGAIAALGGMLLIPSVGTLVMIGRRDQQLDTLNTQVSQIASNTDQISTEVQELSRNQATSEVRNEENRRRIEVLESAARSAGR